MYNFNMGNETEQPALLGFVSDLMFSTRIESTARRLGFQMRWVESADEFGPDDEVPQRRQLGEHLVGRGAVLLDQITRLHPALIIFDLGNGQIPWREWMALIKSVPATRRIPVLAFGSHVDVDTFKDARARGADVVLARSRFISSLPDLLLKHARVVDAAALEADCEGPLSPLALEGLEAFNRGEYFEQHELLEEAWIEESRPIREMYQGILQVGVAFFHIEQGNWAGAIKLFRRGLPRLRNLPPICQGVDIAGLRTAAEAIHREVAALGPARLHEFDRSKFPQIRLEGGESPIIFSP